MKNTLEILNVAYNCGVDQNGISELTKLKELDTQRNTKINNVSHLKDTLETLNVGGNCGVNQSGISKLVKIKKLDARGNKKINNVNHLKYTKVEK